MNNYNCSTSGFNIEASIFLDETMSQVNFYENIEKCENFPDYYVYTNYGNIDHEIKFNPKLIDLNDLFSIDDSEENHKKFKTFMNNELGYEYSDDLFILSELSSHLYYSTLEDIIKIIECSGIEYKKTFEIISVTGYSQGDYAEVIILIDVLKKIWGIDKIDLCALKNEITHYFYDSPMRCSLTINDKDYYIDKYDGQYQDFKLLTYDKEAVISEVLKQYSGDNVGVLRDELEGVVPEVIGY